MSVVSLLLLLGGIGAGKTHLAIAAARAIVEAGHLVSARYERVPELHAAAREAIDSKERWDPVADACAPRLLVLDDIGAERQTEFSAEILDRVQVKAA